MEETTQNNQPEQEKKADIEETAPNTEETTQEEQVKPEEPKGMLDTFFDGYRDKRAWYEVKS